MFYAVVLLFTVILNTTNVFAYDNTVSNYYVTFTSGFYKDTIQFDYPNKNVFIYKENKTLYFYFYNEDLGKSELIDKTLINNGKFIIKNTYYGTTNEQTWDNNIVSTTSSSITINDTNMVMYTDLNEANTYYDSIYNSSPSTEEPSTEPSTEEPSTEPSTEEPSTEPSTEPGTEPSTEEPSTEIPSVEPSYDLTEEQENLKDSTTNYLYTFLQVFMINGFILATLLSFIGYGVFKAFSLLNIHNRT